MKLELYVDFLQQRTVLKFVSQIAYYLFENAQTQKIVCWRLSE